MVRTVVGLCAALVVSAALVASPCVLCFQPPAPAAHDCCKKKQAPPERCGLHFTELTSPDVPVSKVTSPESAAAVADAAGVTVAVSAPEPTGAEHTARYASPPVYLLVSVLRV
jgi:hypothetical protein